MVWILDRSAPRGFIDLLEDKYEGVVICVRTTCREIGDLTLGLYQGGSYRFALVLIKKQVPWCMIFLMVTFIKEKQAVQEGYNDKPKSKIQVPMIKKPPPSS